MKQDTLLKRGLVAIAVLGVLLLPFPAYSHAFSIGQTGYQNFLSGNVAVFADIPVLLGLIAAGIFAGIWNMEGFPKLWPFYVAGLVGGLLLGLTGLVPAALPTYCTVVIVGLLAAAAPDFPTWLMRLIYFLIGVVLTNAVITGHTIDSIPIWSYIGIAFALNFGLVIPAGLVVMSRQNLPYGWVLITWRAGSSWLVAIAVMAMVLMLNSAD
jgi:hypothetical protein